MILEIGQKASVWTIVTLVTFVFTSQVMAADLIFAAKSFSGSPLPVFNITDGKKADYAMLNAGGWIGSLGTPDNIRLYAVTNAFNGSLWDITGGGDFTTAPPFASNLFPGGVHYLKGLAFDTSGKAYITNSEAGLQRIAVVSADGEVSYLGDTKTFNNACGLAVQGNTLYIAEGGAGHVLAYDLIRNASSVLASGFTIGNDHVSAELAIDTRGHLLVLWCAGTGSTYGLFDITAGGDFTGQAPLVTAPFQIDVNQIAVDSQNNVYAAGNGGGIAYVARFINGGFRPFVPFAKGLEDTESIIVLRSVKPNKGKLVVKDAGGKKNGTIKVPQVGLIIDASGSMKEKVNGQARMDMAKKALKTVVQGLHDDIEVALRIYGHSIREGQPGDCANSELIVPFRKMQKDELTQAIEKITPLGTTPISYSLRQMADDFSKDVKERIIVLVTDGKEECGGDLIATVEKLQQQGIETRVNIVGFQLTDETTRSLMERAAAASGGQYFNADNAENLQKAIDQALSAHFEVRDAAGTLVAQGAIDGQPLDLPQGIFDIVLKNIGDQLILNNVHIVDSKETVIQVKMEGEKITLEVQ